MDPVASTTAAPATTGTDTTAVPAGDATANVGPATGFHDTLAKATERLQSVKGHHYAKVVGGGDDGMYVNRSHNDRHGQRFEIVRRAGRIFHVYGTGDQRTVVELPSAAKTAAEQAAKDGTAAKDPTSAKDGTDTKNATAETGGTAAS